MEFIRRFPISTALLAAGMLIIYWLLSANTPYVTNENISEYALNNGNPISILSHLFVHVGVLHLAGNLIPLILFGLVLESVVLSVDVILIFLISGMGASLLFSLVNPSIPLIGASAGIAGMLASVLLVRPKAALLLLIGIPILISLVLFPAVEFGESLFEERLAGERGELREELVVAVQENRSVEAIRQINQTLQITEERIETTYEGKRREAATPSDFLVHVYGAMIGGFYIYFFKRRRLKAAEKEFVDLGALIYEKLDDVSKFLKKR